MKSESLVMENHVYWKFIDTLIFFYQLDIFGHNIFFLFGSQLLNYENSTFMILFSNFKMRSNFKMILIEERF